MRHNSIKSIIFLVLLLIAKSVFATPFSNIIFFGDSLSDIGNFPIAKYPYLDPSLPASLPNSYGMFYVPVSNPVNLQGYKVSIVDLFNLQHKPYQWPKESTQFLPETPSINGLARQSRSYSWVDFFIVDAHQDGILQANQVAPSMLIRQRNLKLSILDSVDYAFSNATSTVGCNYKYAFTDYGACSYDVISAASRKFQLQPTVNNYNKVIIPGLRRQIDLFQEDVHQQRVVVGDNTLYSIWIGGNDLLQDLFLLRDPQWRSKLAAFKNLNDHLIENNRIAIITLINDPAIKAKHIVIFGFFNPVKIVPVMHDIDWIEKISIQTAVAHYNYQLKQLVKQLSKSYPDVQIQYEPVPIWFKQMTDKSSRYQKIFDQAKIGKACQLQDPAYTYAATPTENCKGYLFWNSLHPSSSVQQIIGYLVDNSLKPN